MRCDSASSVWCSHSDGVRHYNQTVKAWVASEQAYQWPSSLWLPNLGPFVCYDGTLTTFEIKVRYENSRQDIQTLFACRGYHFSWVPPASLTNNLFVASFPSALFVARCILGKYRMRQTMGKWTSARDRVIIGGFVSTNCKYSKAFFSGAFRVWNIDWPLLRSPFLRNAATRLKFGTKRENTFHNLRNVHSPVWLVRLSRSLMAKAVVSTISNLPWQIECLIYSFFFHGGTHLKHRNYDSIF